MSARKVRVKVLKVVDVFPRYRPRVGQIYDAVYSPARSVMRRNVEVQVKQELCVIDIRDKKILLRHGEFEIVS